MVEDEPGILEPILALLRREGYEALGARNLEEAWSLLAEGEPDVLILGIMLPEGEDAGFRFAEALCQGGFRGGILLLTARDALEDQIHGLKLGEDDYPVKAGWEAGTGECPRRLTGTLEASEVTR